MKKKILAAFTLLLTASFALAADPFIKFELKDFSSGETPTEVKISLPFGMLEALKPTIDNALNEVELHDNEIDLRAIWQEVKNAGPNEYVSIKDGDKSVQVATTETHIVIKVDEDGEDINVTIPLALADALLGQEHPDFDKVIDTLLEFRGQDLLTITGSKIEARAWIE